jgi:hypothetical protein
MAEGDPASAVSPLRDAVRRWHELDAPYEAARARTRLAEAYLAIADEDAAVLELEAALSIFERLGAAAAARRVTELLRPGRADATTDTFLFTDVCGSTSLIEAIGDRPWLDLVEWHDRTLRALFAVHGGEEIDHAGDGFFVAFPEPSPAFACGVAIQRALAEHRRHHGFAPPTGSHRRPYGRGDSRRQRLPRKRRSRGRPRGSGSRSERDRREPRDGRGWTSGLYRSSLRRSKGVVGAGRDRQRRLEVAEPPKRVDLIPFERGSRTRSTVRVHQTALQNAKRV